MRQWGREWMYPGVSFPVRRRKLIKHQARKARERLNTHKNNSDSETQRPKQLHNLKVCVKWTAWESKAGLNESGSGFVLLHISESTLTIQKAIIYFRCPTTLRCQHTHTLQCFFWLSDNTKLPFICPEPATDWLFCLGLLEPDQCKHGTFLRYRPWLRYLIGSVLLQITLTWFCYENWVHHYSTCASLSVSILADVEDVCHHQKICIFL